MNLLNLKSVGSALLLTIGFSLPAAAQLTYNFGTSGNCNYPPGTCVVTGSASVANTLTIGGWAASSGANFVATTLTDQGTSGVGMASDGSGTPNHAIDNVGNLELVLLNFNNNKVVLNWWSTGYSANDTDVTLLRWVGAATGPDLANTANFTNKTSAQLLTLGWELVKNVDMDSNQSNTNPGTSTEYGTLTASSGLTVNTTNSSSWWIISAYFQGGSTAPLTNGDDYFKLLSVNATCVSSTSGGACNSTKVPEPGSLALAGVALLGLYGGRRRFVRTRQ